jgi:hypothetical protein
MSDQQLIYSTVLYTDTCNTPLPFQLNTEAGILVENFHRRGQALKSTLNFFGKSPCISLGFSDRDRSLKEVHTVGTQKFRPLYLEVKIDSPYRNVHCTEQYMLLMIIIAIGHQQSTLLEKLYKFRYI